MTHRSIKTINILVDGENYQADLIELPFREGVELECEVGGELLRVSDRGLGEDEAVRLMKELIKTAESNLGLSRN